MKVFYASTKDKINKAIYRAENDQRAIEYIELTTAEFDAFQREAGFISMCVGPQKRCVTWRGVELREATTG